MTDRERLIDLMIEAKRTEPETGSFTEHLADYLLEHGVIVLLCKIGDNVYRTGDPIKKVYEFSVTCIEIFEDEVVFIDDSDNEFTEHDIGKTVFLTREEAEEALKERNGS